MMNSWVGCKRHQNDVLSSIQFLPSMFRLSYSFFLLLANYSYVAMLNKTFLTRTVFAVGSLAITEIKSTLH